MTPNPQASLDSSTLQPGAVEYVTPEWAPPGQRYFDCTRLRAKLSTSACEINFRRASGNESEALWRCKGCPIGAKHVAEAAGSPVEASAPPSLPSTTCARCREPNGRLINAWLCITCYNREREFRVGGNRRGKIPTNLAGLTRRSIRVYEASSGHERVIGRDLTLDTEELVTAALRDVKNPVFAFRGVGAITLAPQVQLGLF